MDVWRSAGMLKRLIESLLRGVPKLILGSQTCWFAEKDPGSRISRELTRSQACVNHNSVSCFVTTTAVNVDVPADAMVGTANLPTYGGSLFCVSIRLVEYSFRFEDRSL